VLPARDTLGHANLSTTSIYVHGEDDLRHAAINAAHKVGWGVESI
jgi:site-specific recombinase XerD